MSNDIRRALNIAPGHNSATLSAKQKKFNALIKQIDKRRARLRHWEAVTPVFQRQYASELLPLEQRLTGLQRQMALRLDDAWGSKALTKTERRTASELIVDLTAALLDDVEDDGGQLKALFNKHSESDYESKAAADLEEMKSAIEEALGINLGDDLDMASAADVLQRMQDKMQEEQEREETEHHAAAQAHARRKKSARQQAAQARQEAEQAELSQSVRDIYRKLASALHPDREPDPHERERKTGLMQQANQAYEKNNLLRLLELQLELEHIDQKAISDISDARLKHYNKILKEQIEELDQEIEQVENAFREACGVLPLFDVAPDTILHYLAEDILELRQGIAETEKDLRAIDDPKRFKTWLKKVKRQREAYDFDSPLY